MSFCVVAISGCDAAEHAGGNAGASAGGESSPGEDLSSATRPAVPTELPPPASAPKPTAVDAGGLAQQTASGQALGVGTWSSNGVVLSFHARAAEGETLVPEVEVAQAGQAFTNTPTAHGVPVEANDGNVQAHISLADLKPGQYRWQARFKGAQSGQEGKWTVFSAEDVAFGIVGRAPSIEQFVITGAVRSPEGVLVVAQMAQPRIEWTVASEPLAALDHLSYLADHEEKATPAAPSGSRALPADSRSLEVNDLGDGQWYLHLWAVDKAGQAAEPVTLAVTIARMPARISDVIFRSWATNPLYQTVPMQFTLSRSANVDLTILAQVNSAPVRVYHLGHHLANNEIKASWDGKDEHGQVVVTGSYAFLVDVVDDAGNRAQARYNGLTIGDKVIRVSLSDQSLTAYAGSEQFVTTMVTSGGQALPTPTGTFEILSRDSPFVFHSPFPQGSSYWYPDVTSQHAMLFYQADADFIHDAPWRTVFGPGSNGPGIPGAAFTGSHGCVELPADAMPKLYDWTPLGTPVIVTP